MWIWHEHNMYFRRYGLQDGYTVFLNAVLLFVVMFYVRAYVGHLVSAAVGMVVVIVPLALPPRLTFVSPMCFGLMGPAHWAWGTYAGRRRRALETRFRAEPARPL
ncbi:MAG: hypothetical protein LC753_14255 [Acidobacteria bacterium]|nr:hypothetical protein [Acidobacteriota bacterium]